MVVRAGRPSTGGLAVATRAYHENIIDHYENPRNVGSLDKKSKFVGTGLVGAPACGDVMKLQFETDENGTIVDAKFKTFGCGSAIASSSVATEWLKGKTIDECTNIKNTDIANHLKLPPVKLHCSMLAEPCSSSTQPILHGPQLLTRFLFGISQFVRHLTDIQMSLTWSLTNA